MSSHAQRAVIFGLAGPELSSAEKKLFQQCPPWGFILFARNISNARQLCELTDALKELTGNPHTPILIDQEGGRVARLKPPLAKTHPPAALYGKLYDIDPKLGMHAARLGGRLIASELKTFGFNIDCLPCLDLGLTQTSDVIGDRAYGKTAEKVAALGHAAAEGLMDIGVLPVIKHLPGHGRGQVDSHFELPIVDTSLSELEKTDFESFRLCSILPLGMTGHLKFTSIDEHNVSTFSQIIISQVIRGYINFNGLLMSDDISMQALSGNIQDRAINSLAAGCDLVLHCNGNMSEMNLLADHLPDLSSDAKQRAQRVENLLSTPVRDYDILKTQEDWGEIISKHFPEAADAL